MAAGVRPSQHGPARRVRREQKAALIWEGEVEEFDRLRYAEEYVAKYFDGDAQKIEAWWNTPNPGLGNIAPLSMVAYGRTQNLFNFIEHAEAMNKLA